MQKTLSIFAFVSLLSLCYSLSAESIWLDTLQGTGSTAGENVAELVVKLKETTLFGFLKSVGLDQVLAQDDPPAPFTLFGPTDDAFTLLPKPVVDVLTKNATLLKDVLLYHVLSGRVFSSQLKNDLIAKSLFNSAPIRINIYKGGQVVTAQGSPINLAYVNQNATNGVVHELNKVMLPPMGSVVDVVVSVLDFSILKTAVVKAALDKVLGGPGPFTVFAPTDKAFNKLPAGILDDLLKDVKKLTYVLEYHVVSGTFYSAGLTNGTSVQTLNKENFTVLLSGGGVTIKTQTGMSRVVAPDVSITNGVIHVIDEVLIPPMMY